MAQRIEIELQNEKEIYILDRVKDISEKQLDFSKRTYLKGINDGDNDPKGFLNLSVKRRFLIVLWILDKFKKTQTFNMNVSSYGLKHRFGDSCFGFYVNNGQFKGAMLVAGFSPKDINEINWHFKVSNSSVRQLRNLENNLNA